LGSKTDIQEGGFSPDLTSSLLKNQVLKTKILLFLFSFIFLVQCTILCILALSNDPILTTLPVKGFVFGPLYILFGVVCEYLYLRLLKKHIKLNKPQKPLFSYMVAFTEISFPSTLMLLIVFIANDNTLLPVNEIVSSPPFILYFILIILSSLNLDKKISIFYGLVAGLQYFSICFYFKNHYAPENFFIPNFLGKSVLLFISGLVTGFVSDKIKAAVTEALFAQDKLINKLDVLVKEKTLEITQQKTEIELQHFELKEKQREILDSIHYAKRIQQSLLPTQKYIDRNLQQLKNKNNET